MGKRPFRNNFNLKMRLNLDFYGLQSHSGSGRIWCFGEIRATEWYDLSKSLSKHSYKILTLWLLAVVL
jgi:hypothetical protein